MNHTEAQQAASQSNVVALKQNEASELRKRIVDALTAAGCTVDHHLSNSIYEALEESDAEGPSLAEAVLDMAAENGCPIDLKFRPAIEGAILQGASSITANAGERPRAEAAFAPNSAQDGKAGGDIATEQAQSAHTTPTGGPLAPTTGTAEASTAHESAPPAPQNNIAGIVAANTTTEPAQTDEERKAAQDLIDYALPEPISSEGYDPSKVPCPIQPAIDEILDFGEVTIIGGPGGSSKSTFRTNLMLDAAHGRGTLGFWVWEPTPTLSITLEDTTEIELARDHAADINRPSDKIAKKGEREKSLFLDGVNFPLRLFERDNANLPAITAQVKILIDYILRHGARIVSFDTAKRLGGTALEENSNVDMDLLILTLRRIARETNAAVLLVAHSPKGADGYSADDLCRGGSSAKDGARNGFTFWNMTDKEADSYGIDHDDMWQYKRLVNVKVNHSPNSVRIRWYKVEGEVLKFDDPRVPEKSFPYLVPVSLTKVAAKTKLPRPEAVRILDAMRDGTLERKRENSKSADWLGHEIIKAMGYDPMVHDDKQVGEFEKAAKKLIKSWTTYGFIQKTTQRIDGRDAPVFVCGTSSIHDVDTYGEFK